MRFIKFIFIILIIVIISVFLFDEKEDLSFERPIPIKFSEKLREDYRKLPFTGAHNFRDLGGYKTKDGRTVKWGKIYRSDNLHSLTDEDLKYMKRLNIESVVDFRSVEERENEPNRLNPNMTEVNLPIKFQPKELDDDSMKNLIKDLTFGDLDSSNLLRDFNIVIVEEFAEEYKNFFRYIIENNAEPLVFHCTAGKDRAGFASAMILTILGVTRDKVIEDYLLTNTYVKDHVDDKMLEIELKTFFRADTDNLRKINLVEEKYIQAAFDTIDSKWGGMDRYISEALNLNEEDILKLQDFYLE
ncbi:MAG: protein tyrosine/serine phosphatase [Rhodobiaceae bacterium]|nr:protein tyrosine/serine phosphatase [Rhodobiaceae bacterium]|tara:strand:+ start:1302 stop:2204 length:903 start_codon:yes stop_codon:yes gene_type:complete